MGLFSGIVNAVKKVASPLVSGVFGLAGGAMDNSAAADAMAANVAYQREFAKHGIRWRVADAEAAGLHPLAAVGAQTHSFSPSYVEGGGGMGDAISRVGSSIANAMYKSDMEKLQESLLKAQINDQTLDTSIKSSEYASQQALRRMIPGMPFGAHSGNVIPMFQSVMRPDGTLSLVPSDEYGQIMENYPPEMIKYLPHDVDNTVNNQGRSGFSRYLKFSPYGKAAGWVADKYNDYYGRR